MTLYNKNIGKIGEAHATKFLLEKGYRILENSYSTHWGELDIIAEHKNVLIFVEVKTRIGEDKGKPYEAVHYHKLSNLKRPIQFYLLQHKRLSAKCRLDVIGILLDEKNFPIEIKHYENVVLNI